MFVCLILFALTAFYSLYPAGRYLIAISKLRLGILTEPEQGELELEGSYQEPELVQVQVPIFTRSSLICLFNRDFALLRARPGPGRRLRACSHRDPAAAGAA